MVARRAECELEVACFLWLLPCCCLASPCQVQVCPKKRTSLHFNCSLSLLNTMPFCRASSIRLAKSLSCSYSVEPKTKVSSAMPVTPLRSSSADSSCFWETRRPKGSRVDQNLPKGVPNVVRYELVSSRGTCQYPFLASTRVQNLALLNWVTTSLIVLV